MQHKASTSFHFADQPDDPDNTGNTNNADDTDEFKDVDRLFNKLEHFDPPANMVARIMGAVSKLPSYPQLEKLKKETTFSEQDGMIVYYDNKEPS
ncbi:hypothetical protein [Dictyobacter arantiisoli]|uniref:Uncharacterized protein n=1 Tax=Dictyobacter arantiisoli TaxID=2014874 RepID=A0A5A5TKP3_9CHLR|nr:hypothetical protein [Dictyobacter arantiisoli]GCF11629.1 hypothetical protein KDI_51930 [Dictyobacter arantiisoli]